MHQCAQRPLHYLAQRHVLNTENCVAARGSKCKEALNPMYGSIPMCLDFVQMATPHPRPASWQAGVARSYSTDNYQVDRMAYDFRCMRWCNGHACVKCSRLWLSRYSPRLPWVDVVYAVPTGLDPWISKLGHTSAIYRRMLLRRMRMRAKRSNLQQTTRASLSPAVACVVASHSVPQEAVKPHPL